MARKPTRGQTGGSKTSDRGGKRGGETQKPVTIDLTATEVGRAEPEPAKTAGDALRREEAAVKTSQAPQAAAGKPSRGSTSGAETAKASEAPLKSGPTGRADGRGARTAEQRSGAASQDSFQTGSSAKAETPDTGDAPKAAAPPRSGDMAAGPSVRTSVGMGTLIVAAAIGGFVALVAAAGLQRAGILENGADVSPMMATVDDLESRIGALETRAGRIASTSETARDNLAARLAAAESALANAGIPDLSPVIRQVEALAARLDMLEARTGETGPDVTAEALTGLRDTLAAAEGRISALESALAGGGTNRSVPDETQVSALSGRIEAETEAREALVVAVRDEYDVLAGRVANLEQANSDVTDRTVAMENRVGDLASALAAADPGPALEEIGAAASSATVAADRALNAALGVAPAVAALSLVDALETGRPFAAELDAANSLVPEVVVPESVRARAAEGLPELDRIAGDFQMLVPALVASEPDSQAPRGTFGRLVRGMQNIVEVRPAGPVGGEDPFAIISRIDDHLRNGNLEAALDEWDGLDAGRQALSQEWRDRAAAARDASRLAAMLRQTAMARLAAEN